MRLDHLSAPRPGRAYGLESVTLEHRNMYYRKGLRVRTTATLQTHFSFRYSSACFRYHIAREHVSCLRMSDRQARWGRTVSCTHLNTPSQVSTRDAFCTTFVLPGTTADRYTQPTSAGIPWNRENRIKGVRPGLKSVMQLEGS
jgi:hypothetical protein